MPDEKQKPEADRQRQIEQERERQRRENEERQRREAQRIRANDDRRTVHEMYDPHQDSKKK